MKHLFSLAFLCIGLFSTAQKKMDKMPTATPSTQTETVVPAQVVQSAPAEFVIEKSKAVMTFESLSVDFGTIANDSDPVRYAKFTNTGTDPLVIKNARGSCGCTVPTWPKEAIAPGQSSTMEIRYDTKRTGRISKTVTVSTNEGVDHQLQVIGEVMPPADDQSVPTAEPTLIKGSN